MNALSLHTLKDFKNTKTEINKKFLFLMCQFYGDLATMNISMSAKHVFRVHTKMINISRATVMLALWRLGRLGITGVYYVTCHLKNNNM